MEDNMFNPFRLLVYFIISLALLLFLTNLYFTEKKVDVGRYAEEATTLEGKIVKIDEIGEKRIYSSLFRGFDVYIYKKEGEIFQLDGQYSTKRVVSIVCSFDLNKCKISDGFLFREIKVDVDKNEVDAYESQKLHFTFNSRTKATLYFYLYYNDALTLVKQKNFDGNFVELDLNLQEGMYSYKVLIDSRDGFTIKEGRLFAKPDLEKLCKAKNEIFRDYDFSEEKCVEIMPCVGCRFGYLCKERWLEKGKEVDFATPHESVRFLDLNIDECLPGFFKPIMGEKKETSFKKDWWCEYKNQKIYFSFKNTYLIPSCAGRLLAPFSGKAKIKGNSLYIEGKNFLVVYEGVKEPREGDVLYGDPIGLPTNRTKIYFLKGNKKENPACLFEKEAYVLKKGKLETVFVDDKPCICKKVESKKENTKEQKQEKLPQEEYLKILSKKLYKVFSKTVAKRAVKILPMIKKYYDKARLKEIEISFETLLALIYQESKFNHNLNYSGGHGIMQLTKGSVPECFSGKKFVCSLEESLDKGTKLLHKKAEEVRRYLSRQHLVVDNKTFQILVLSAYNRGNCPTARLKKFVSTKKPSFEEVKKAYIDACVSCVNDGKYGKFPNGKICYGRSCFTKREFCGEGKAFGISYGLKIFNLGLELAR